MRRVVFEVAQHVPPGQAGLAVDAAGIYPFVRLIRGQTPNIFIFCEQTSIILLGYIDSTNRLEIGWSINSSVTAFRY